MQKKSGGIEKKNKQGKSRFASFLLIGFLAFVFFASSISSAPVVYAQTGWTVTVQLHGSWSRSDSGLQLTATVSGSSTLHLTVTDGQISGSGSGTYHQSPVSGTIDAGGQSGTITAAGFQASETDSVSGTVSSDNTPSLVVTTTSTNAPASISGTLTAEIDGQTQTQPFEIPVTYNSGGTFQVKLQDGYSATVPVSASGIQGQFVITVSGSSSSPSPTFTSSPSSSASPASALSLTDVHGTVQVERNGVKITTSQLQSGDKVTTGDGSSATITFADGSIVKLGPTATFELTSLGETQSVITLLLGKLHAFFNSRFQTRTPAAVLANRGTEYVVEVTEMVQPL